MNISGPEISFTLNLGYSLQHKLFNSTMESSTAGFDWEQLRASFKENVDKTKTVTAKKSVDRA